MNNEFMAFYNAFNDMLIVTLTTEILNICLISDD